MNPVRAGMTVGPADYPWSSHGALAGGAADAIVSAHELYRALGRNAGERRIAYRALFDRPLDVQFVEGLRAATNGGWACGGDRFKHEIAKALGRRVAPLPAGRKAKDRDNDEQIKLL